MVVKDIQDETLQDYKKVAMLISACSCDWKCCKEASRDICQNLPIAKNPTINISNDDICKRYIANPVSKAMIFGGLEPILQASDILGIVGLLRGKYKCNDDVVIYTGYTKKELIAMGFLQEIKKFNNIIIKFGRFVPDAQKRYDRVLGVLLASDNQYAEKVS